MRGPNISGCPGWLMTAVAPWGENQEDAYDQGLVELGLGDARFQQRSRDVPRTGANELIDTVDTHVTCLFARKR